MTTSKAATVQCDDANDYEGGLSSVCGQFNTACFTVSVECDVCMYALHEPKTLHCGHTFCGGCIDDMTHKATRRIECPTCRAPMLIPLGGLKKSVLVGQLIAECEAARLPLRDRYVCVVGSAIAANVQRRDGEVLRVLGRTRRTGYNVLCNVHSETTQSS
jgi:hypothetical protein